MKIFGGTKLYYVMFVGVASVIPATALAVPSGAKFHARLNDESHGNDIESD